MSVSVPTVVHWTPFPQLSAARPAAGVPAFVSRLLPAYAQAGVPYQRVIADRDDGRGRAREYPFPAVEVSRSFTPGVRIAGAAVAMARAYGDVVHAQHEVFLFGGPAAAVQFPLVLRVGARRRPTVVTIHGVPDLAAVDADFVAANGSRFPAAVVRRMLRRLVGGAAAPADAVIVHDQVLADRLGEQYGVASGKVVVIPLPVPAAIPVTREDARRQRGFSRPTALFFGFVTGYKGLPLLLDAWELYRASGGDGELVVAGGRHPRLAGQSAYEREYGQLMTRAGEIGGVRWDGYAAEEDVPAYLAGADALVLPYRDGLAASGPMSLALAYGLPVLASEVMASTAPHPGGVFRRDAARLAEMIHDALHTSLGRQLGDASRQVARGRSLETVAERTVSLYRSLAAR